MNTINTENNQAPSIRVSLLLFDPANRILLVKHRKNGREYWVLPGGHLEYGETIEECAVRELLEETSLTGKFDRLVSVSESIAPNGSRHIINLFALLQNETKGELKIGDGEDMLTDLRYFDLDELKNITLYPDLKDFLKDGLAENWASFSVRVIKTPWS